MSLRVVLALALASCVASTIYKPKHPAPPKPKYDGAPTPAKSAASIMHDLPIFSGTEDPEPSRPYQLSAEEKASSLLWWQKMKLQKYVDDNNVILIIRSIEEASLRRMSEMVEVSGENIDEFGHPIDGEGGFIGTDDQQIWEYNARCKDKAPIQTKGLNTHQKSSNWGPMWGLVTVDPFFSKAVETLKFPSKNPMELESVHNLKKVDYVHLVREIQKEEAELAKKTVVLAETKPNESPVSETYATGWGIIQLRVKLKNSGHLDPLPDGMQYCDHDKCATPGKRRVCIRQIPSSPPPAKKPNKEHVVFCVEPVKKLAGGGFEGIVTWRHDSVDAAQTPLLVFAYSTSGTSSEYSESGTPITGDFDIWAVAFKTTSPLLRIEQREKRHGFKNLGYTSLKNIVKFKGRLMRGGEGFASKVEYRLIDRGDPANINLAVMGSSRGACQVFLHPEEMFNKEFTQPIPGEFIIIVPSGIVLMVRGQRITTGRLILPNIVVDGKQVPDYSYLGELLVAMMHQEYIFPMNENYGANLKAVYSQLRASGATRDSIAVFTAQMQASGKKIFGALISALRKILVPSSTETEAPPRISPTKKLWYRVFYQVLQFFNDETDTLAAASTLTTLGTLTPAEPASKSSRSRGIGVPRKAGPSSRSKQSSSSTRVFGNGGEIADEVKANWDEYISKIQMEMPRLTEGPEKSGEDDA